mgnify:CR=1 FL=1
MRRKRFHQIHKYLHFNVNAYIDKEENVQNETTDNSPEQQVSRFDCTIGFVLFFR